jgi:Transposase
MEMQLLEPTVESFPITFRPIGLLKRVPANPETSETKLIEMRTDKLRKAIRKNQVSFPSQVPSFPKHDRPDLQQKLAQLYFVCGWSGPKIGARYGLSRLRVQQILNTWKRRAVEQGYIQTVPPTERTLLSPDRPPIRVVLSRVVNAACAPVIELPPSSPSDSQRSTCEQVPNRVDSQRGYRSRTKFDTSQVAGVLKQLQAGRTPAEIADELGTSAHTIRVWKEQQEMRLLRRENAQLKAQLAQSHAVEKTLMDLITRSDNAQSSSFMPFSRISHHTESDYRESL